MIIKIVKDLKIEKIFENGSTIYFQDIAEIEINSSIFWRISLILQGFLSKK